MAESRRTAHEARLAGCLHAKNRGIQDVICATTHTAQFKPHSMPAVGLFDVVEHIEDDPGLLRSMKELLKQGGCLYATVPSYPLLWSDEDVTAGHFRRYGLRSICRVLEAAGFEIAFASYIFRFLPLPIFLLRTIPCRIGLTGRSQKTDHHALDHAVKGETTGGILDALLKSEIEHFKNRRPMAFGGSCLVVAKSR